MSEEVHILHCECTLCAPSTQRTKPKCSSHQAQIEGGESMCFWLKTSSIYSPSHLHSSLVTCRKTLILCRLRSQKESELLLKWWVGCQRHVEYKHNRSRVLKNTLLSSAKDQVRKCVFLKGFICLCRCTCSFHWGIQIKSSPVFSKAAEKMLQLMPSAQNWNKLPHNCKQTLKQTTGIQIELYWEYWLNF